MGQRQRQAVPDHQAGGAECREYFSGDFRRNFRRLKRTEKRRHAEGNRDQGKGNQKPGKHQS
jgi:hypothetical protein